MRNRLFGLNQKYQAIHEYNSTHILDIYDNLWKKVFYYLNINEIASVQTSCQYFNKISHRFEHCSRVYYDHEYYKLSQDSPSNVIFDKNMLVCGFFRQNNCNPCDVSGVVLKYIGNHYPLIKIEIDSKHRCKKTPLMIFDTPPQQGLEDKVSTVAIKLTKHDFSHGSPTSIFHGCFFYFGVIGVKKCFDFSKFLNLFHRNEFFGGINAAEVSFGTIKNHALLKQNGFNGDNAIKTYYLQILHCIEDDYGAVYQNNDQVDKLYQWKLGASYRKDCCIQKGDTIFIKLDEKKHTLTFYNNMYQNKAALMCTFRYSSPRNPINVIDDSYNYVIAFQCIEEIPCTCWTKNKGYVRTDTTVIHEFEITVVN